MNLNCIGIASSFHCDENIAVIETCHSGKKLRKTDKLELKVIANEDTLPCSVANKKLKKLMELVASNTIPRAYHGFYNNLNGADVDEETDQEEDDLKE